MDIVANRFDYLYKDLEARLEREKFKALLEFERGEALSRIDTLEEEYRLRRAELEEGFRAIVRANEPTLLPSGQFDRLFEIARQTYRDPRGVERPVLTPEGSALPIDPERESRSRRAHPDRIARHPQFQFPSANSMDQGNPRNPPALPARTTKNERHGLSIQLKSDEIPIQAKIMTICGHI